MSEQEKIQLFEDQKIRTAWDTEKEEWYFSVTDVISVLTGQQTARGASNYWAKLKQRLKEEKGQGGAYYCSLPSFRDSYRLVTRMLERSGQSAYLMLCSLTDGKGHPLEKPEKLELLSEELQNTIQHCLRKGDSFTKYSPSQYLVLLIGTNKENCGLIFDRIRKYFAREHRSWNKYVEFYVSSVAEVDNLDTPIQFRNDDSGWK